MSSLAACWVGAVIGMIVSDFQKNFGSSTCSFSWPFFVGMAPKVYQDLADRDQTFAMLARDFKWEEKTRVALLKRDIQDLDDFRYLFNTESEITTWVTTVADVADPGVAAARIKRAWAAVRKQGALRDEDKSQVPVQDLDAMLGDDDLLERKQKFWNRYHMEYPPEIMPADSLVSRVAREMEKLLLMVFNIALVRTMMHQITTNRKKTRVGDNLYTDAADDQIDGPAVAGDAFIYMNNLFTYLLALAIAGVHRKPAAGPPETETLGSSSAAFVNVPLDVVMAYWYRASRMLQSLPPSNKLSVLSHLCSEERAMWVTRFRRGTQTLGEVIQEVMQLRDAHWTGGPKVVAAPASSPSGVLAGAGAGGGAPGQSGGKGSSPTKTKTLRPCLSEMQDGTKLCDKYNKGMKCDAKTCRFVHRCGTDIGNGKVCSSWNHSYVDCPCKGKP